MNKEESKETKDDLFTKMKEQVLIVLKSWQTEENMLNEDCILHDMADDLTDMFFKELVK